MERNNLTLKVFRMKEDAVLPSSREDDAGYDLYSYGEYKINLGIPSGYYGRIAPKSGLAFKYNYDILAGVVDCSFVGEIMIKVINHGEEVINIASHEKVAQLIIEKIAKPEILD